MPPVVDDVVREAQKVVDMLDRLQATLEEIRQEIRRWLQTRGEDLAASFFPEERREHARALVRRGLAILDEVAEWAATQGPAGLLNKLIPQLKGAVHELRALIEAPADGVSVSTGGPSEVGNGRGPSTRVTPGGPQPSGGPVGA